MPRVLEGSHMSLDSNALRVWVEITRRPNDDIGRDLNHDSHSRHAYGLLSQPQPGDKVLHWDSKRSQFVGVSTVQSRHRDRGTNRCVRLTNFVDFPKDALTLVDVRRHGPQLGRIRDGLNTGKAPTNFPFAPYGTAGWKNPRPALAYLTVAPPALVTLLGEIYEGGRTGDASVPSWTSFGFGKVLPEVRPHSAATPGFRRYLLANEGIVLVPGKEAAVPNLKALELAYQQHNRLQNQLARWLASKGFTAESQRAMDRYPVDIQWRSGKKLFVGEVKSLTSKNELHQMRRGLGQILHYRYLAAEEHPDSIVVPVLITPAQPSHEWTAICDDAGVTLVWPKTFKKLLTL